jgi:hypothetical protein
MYIQRYLTHFPAAGEVVIFDRSWYNRAGVEPVMGFCAPAETERFLRASWPGRAPPAGRSGAWITRSGPAAGHRVAAPEVT